LSHPTQQATIATYPGPSIQPHLTKIELFVQPAKLDDLKEELVQWATTLVWSEVNFHLDERRQVGVYRGSEYAVDSTAMVKVEAFVPSRMVGRVIAAIEQVLPPASVRHPVFAVMSGEDLASSRADAESGASDLTGAD
jgi:nitrogen regulatory protein PII